MSMFTLYIYIVYIDIYYIYIYTLIERDIKKYFQMRHDTQYLTLLFTVHEYTFYMVRVDSQMPVRVYKDSRTPKRGVPCS